MKRSWIQIFTVAMGPAAVMSLVFAGVPTQAQDAGGGAVQNEVRRLPRRRRQRRNRGGEGRQNTRSRLA